MTFMPRSWSILLFLWLAAPAAAQWLSQPVPSRGGGTFSDCNPSLQVDFQVNPLGDLAQEFVATIVPGSTMVTGTVWTVYTTDILQLEGAVAQATYPAPGVFPVCLSVSAFDLGIAQSCSTTVCRFVPIWQDPSCQGYEPDFTIANVQGSSITFTDILPFASEGVSLLWDFGDGSSLAGTGPSHQFDGPGPHQVCLTVIGPLPHSCTATICKWLYLGPGGVPCDEVLEPGFLAYRNENVLLLLDTSVTRGQSSSLTWDLGDGTTAQGGIVLHVYPPWSGAFEVCATVDLWGPLVTDTCEATVCRIVEHGAVLSTAEGVDRVELRAYPVPAQEHLVLDGLVPGGVDISLWDATGRQLRSWKGQSTGHTHRIDLSGLAPGQVFLEVHQGDRVGRLRILKE
jgi:hypothetical protein